MYNYCGTWRYFWHRQWTTDWATCFHSEKYMICIRQENKYSSKYMLSTCENGEGHTDTSWLLSPSENVQFHGAHSLPKQQQKQSVLVLGKERKSKRKRKFSIKKCKKKNYPNNYILLGFFILLLPHITKSPVS